MSLRPIDLTPKEVQVIRSGQNLQIRRKVKPKSGGEILGWEGPAIAMEKIPSDDPEAIHVRAVVCPYGTKQDNANDRVQHGGYKQGVSHINAKLTHEQVDSIRNKRALGTKVKDLAKEFTVSTSTIESVLYGKSYKVIQGGSHVSQDGTHHSQPKVVLMMPWKGNSQNYLVR